MCELWIKRERERDLQGRGRIEDSMGAQGENGAVEEMKDHHHSLFSLRSKRKKFKDQIF